MEKYKRERGDGCGESESTVYTGGGLRTDVSGDEQVCVLQCVVLLCVAVCCCVLLFALCCSVLFCVAVLGDELVM